VDAINQLARKQLKEKRGGEGGIARLVFLEIDVNNI